MEAWPITYYTTALTILIIPIILCYNKFDKGEAGSYKNGAYIFAFTFIPGIGGSGIGPVINSFSTLLIIIYIFAFIIGIGIMIINFIILRKNAKESHDDYAFNHASGLIGVYGLFYFFTYGTLILLFKDDEDFSFFELAYRKRAWIYYFVELIYFAGLFLSSCTEFFILKYNLNKNILIAIVIFQSLLYAFNLVIILDFKILYIIFIIVVSLIQIGYGIYIWKNKYSDKEVIIPIREEFKLTANPINE